MNKLKRLFSNKNFLISLIAVTTILIVVTFLTLIYTKDKPSFVPEETRGEVREAIKTVVAEPIGSVAPAVGRLIKEAAYEKPIAVSVDRYEGWQAYQNKDFKFEFNYPQGWIIKEHPVADLGSDGALFISLDPSYIDKERAQIFIEIFSSELGAVEDRELSNIIVIKKTNHSLDGINGTYYESEILDFKTGERAGIANDWIGEAKQGVIVVTYTTNRLDNRDLLNEYKNILDSIKLY